MGVAYTIKSGDTLSALTRDYYGDVMLYEDLWLANKDKIPNMNVLTVGTVIDLPDVLNGQKRLLTPKTSTSATSSAVKTISPVVTSASSTPIAAAMNMKLVKYAGFGLGAVALIGLVISLLPKKAAAKAS